MDWKFLFTSFTGRIGRQQFWIGAIILLVAAISLKRRHDRGAFGYDIFAFWALNLAGALLVLVGLNPSSFLVGTISIMTGVLGVYLFVVMGFLKGDQGSNIYGPDPLQS